MIYELDGIKPKISGEVFIAESADVIGNVELNDGVNIWFGAVLRGDVEKITIGKNSNVQDNSTLHTDFGLPCVVGENVTVGHNVILHSCEIGDNVIVGMGSAVLNGSKIAPNCLIGASSLVTHKIPYEKGVLILGSPAKIVRKLTDEEIEEIGENIDGSEVWERYVEILKEENYAKKIVELSKIREKMMYFLYEVKKNVELNYSDIKGSIIYIDDGDKYFTDGVYTGGEGDMFI